MKQWREENTEYMKQWREENKEEIKQWRIDNSDKIFNYNNNRRLKEENQGDGISKEQWLEMMKFFEWKCAYSGEVLGDNRTIDHIIPISKGGENEIYNCVPMLRSYNSSKKANDMIEWYIEQPYFSEKRLEKIYQWVEYAYNKWKK